MWQWESINMAYCTRVNTGATGVWNNIGNKDKTMKNLWPNRTLLHNAACLVPMFALMFAALAVLSAPTSATARETAALAVPAPKATPGIEPLTASDCNAMQAANVISARNPLPCLRLARVRFSYIDFEGH